MPKLASLTSKDTLIVLTFAKAGLGHLRVSDALMEGLPSEANSVLFSTRASATTFLHRLTSTSPILRALGEAAQYGLFEDIFTSVYTSALSRGAKNLLAQLDSILASTTGDSQGVFEAKHSKKVVFVSTHFGLAHQIAELKKEVSARTEAEVRLAVIVTDDSPQHPWLVPGADLIIVPSQLTKDRLLAYARSKRLSKMPNIEVASYPVSPKLGQKLTQKKLAYRQNQANPESRSRIKVSLPVSGAAVGLKFYTNIASRLNELNPRFGFFIVSKTTPHTKPFLDKMRKTPYARVFEYEHDRLVVSNYNKVILRNTVSYEVTKPSEQAFKALYSPRERGGVVLLFAKPVGRQEYDNLWYLARKGLIPSKHDQEKLWEASVGGQEVSSELLKKAKSWRGIRLMQGSAKSATLINWCLSQGIFKNMMKYDKPPESSGVEKVWELVDGII